ncbi:MAG: SDR family NAD(P)-dependent oxidoreductase [Chloroflexota bacterium]|nr:SDR family NAD(P)-dependent oxidoreductase [Chloroflexota bacterium]
MKLRDKVALVTGGGSGIGEASCYAFAREGARVAVANRTLAKAEAVARSIEAKGGRAIAIGANVARSADAQRMIDEAVAELGAPDIVFNNAGVSPAGRITDISEADWDECLSIDLKSVFLVARYAIPLMIEAGGGVILNTAGTFGMRAAANKAAYSVAKAGVINLTRSIALDYARDNIRCNAICPGYVDTPLNVGLPPAERDAFLEQYQPLRGIISADEVAELAVYLASDAAKMITGQMFVIDGGQQAGLYA